MDREKLRAQLINHEALRRKPYKCTAGKLTIGVGRNLDDLGISDEEALYLLDNDIKRCERELDASLHWWRDMTEARQRVLLDMCFNLGIAGLLKFKNTLADMKAGDYRKASVGMLSSLWAQQVGSRAARLAVMMEKGT